MLRVLIVSFAVAAGALVASPVSPVPATSKLVTGLSDPDRKARDAASASLRDRADALPWLRRVTRAEDKDAARRAADLLAPHEAKRQEAVAKAIDSCIHDGRIDLLMEWHHYWSPKATKDLWPVGLRATQAGMDLFAKSCPKEVWADFREKLALYEGNKANLPTRAYDGPCPESFGPPFKGPLAIRTNRMDRLTPAMNDVIRFASVAGPVRLPSLRFGGRYLALGPVQTRTIDCAFLACEGDVWNEAPEFGKPVGIATSRCVVICRGKFTAANFVYASVMLVDGDIDLTEAGRIRSSLIRASGEIRLPKGYSPESCTIEAHAKDATAPYKFFELSDVGLSLADDEEGLVVVGVKPGTPFGECGLAKDDLVRAIDDVEVGHSEQFRKQVRRALVRQGDCLVTVTRGDKTFDLPVFFALPK
jgi:hypothetical protein